MTSAAPGMDAKALPAPVSPTPAGLATAPLPPLHQAPTAPPLRRFSATKWHGSAWVLMRDGAAPAGSAAPGLLGAGQAGLRVTRRINARSLALSAGVSLPLSGRAGQEARLGLSWRPLTQLPVELLAERRIGLSIGTPDRFQVLVAGGVSDKPLSGAWRLSGYGQAGVAGARRRLAFADGQILVARPVHANSGLRFGAGLWGAVQPGLGRVDIGPTVDHAFPMAQGSARVSLQWRQRVAGRAQPGSGPAVVLSTGF